MNIFVLASVDGDYIRIYHRFIQSEQAMEGNKLQSRIRVYSMHGQTT